MTESDWDIFKIKFKGNKASAFENLAYKLFCIKHDIKEGVFRYKNQIGLEAEPIYYNGKYIGFQAKFSKRKISDIKNKIIDTIEKGKRKNPNLNKILFYLNQEFSESSKKKVKDPAYKKEIESVAKKLKVEIEWVVPSHFEIILSQPQNSYLKNEYFSLNTETIEVNNLSIHLYIGASHHIHINKLIPSKIRGLFKDNYGYFVIDVFVKNKDKRQYKRITLELIPTNETIPENISFSTDAHITKKSMPNSISSKIIFGPLNNGEFFTKYALFYINYQNYKSTDDPKDILKYIVFKYHLTCDNAKPQTGIIKISNT